jgi:hypothetical protein
MTEEWSIPRKVMNDEWAIREVVDVKSGEYHGLEWSAKTILTPYNKYYALVRVGDETARLGLYDDKAMATNVSYWKLAQMMPAGGE